MSLARRLAAVGAGLAAAALLLAAGPPAGAATPAYTVTTDPVRAGAGWLATQFVGPRYLPTPAGDRFVSGVYGGTTYLNYGENADAVFGLAAAKVAGAKIHDALGFLATHVDAYADISGKQGFGPSDGALGKTALAAIVGGADPTSFGGDNLLTLLKDGECAAVHASSCVAVGGSRNTYTSNSESFVVLAEARAGGAYAPSVRKIDYFLSLQCTGGADAGGFTGGLTACGTGSADLDATSYAVMALEALGGQQAALTRAVDWLKSRQRPGGYWLSNDVPNADSTGLAAAALQGAGADVTKARSWLRSQQVTAGQPGAGAFRFGGTVTATTAAVTSPAVLATAQALTGLVDRGSLATVSAVGATGSVPVYAPVAAVSSAQPAAGSRLTVTGRGFVAGESVRFAVDAGSAAVATGTVDALGTARATVTVPTGLAGAHHVVLTGRTSALVARTAVTVRAASSSTAAASPTHSGAPSSRGAAGTTTVAAAPLAAGPTIAATGQDRRRLEVVALFGATAVLVGSMLLLVGRRRAH